MAKNARVKIIAEDKTKVGIQTAKRNLKSLQNNVASVAGAFTALSSIMAGSYLANQAEAIRIQARMAQQLNITTESLGALSYAIRANAEVSQEQFNDILQEFVTRIGDAQTGTQSIIDAYNMLGISAENLAKMETDKAFLKVVDALSKLNDKTKQQFLLEELFAGEAAKLKPVLDKNAQAIRDLMVEAEDLGILYSQEEAQKIIDTEQALNRLSLAMQGVGVSALSAAVAGGSFPDWIDNITESLVDFKKWIDNNQQGIFNFFKKAMQFTPHAQGLRVIDAYISKLKELTGYQDQAETKKDLVITVTPGSSEQYTPSLPTLGESELSEMLKQEGDALDIYGDVLTRLNENAQNEADRFTQIWGEAFNTFSTGIGGAVADAIVDQESLGKGLQETMRSVAKSIISTLVQIGVQKATLMALEKAGIISNLASTKLAAGGLVGAWSPAATLAATATLGQASITGAASVAAAIASTQSLALAGQMHDGGTVPRTGTYFLEKGELVVPRKETQGIAGPSVNISISAIDSQTGFEFLMKNEGRIIEMIQRAYDARGKSGGPSR